MSIITGHTGWLHSSLPGVEGTHTPSPGAQQQPWRSQPAPSMTCCTVSKRRQMDRQTDRMPAFINSSAALGLSRHPPKSPIQLGGQGLPSHHHQQARPPSLFLLVSTWHCFYFIFPKPAYRFASQLPCACVSPALSPCPPFSDPG